jgi:hypothetical protein
MMVPKVEAIAFSHVVYQAHMLREMLLTCRKWVSVLPTKIVCYKHKHIPFGDFRRKDRDPRKLSISNSKPARNVFVGCICLIFPGIMPQWCPIQFLAIVLPQRHEPVHIQQKALVMMTLKQMHHFMYNNVL